MAYSQQTLQGSIVSNAYQLCVTTEWEGGPNYLNNGESVSSELNASGAYEIIIEVAENSGEQNPVEHYFSLAPTGVVPDNDADIEIIVMEGNTEHGRGTLKIKDTIPNPVYLPTGADEPERPIGGYTRVSDEEEVER